MSYTIPPALLQQYRDAVEEALTAEGHAVLAAALQIVPRRDNYLADSGEVTTFWAGNLFWVVVGFGNGSQPRLDIYAIVQHERTDYKHNPGEQAKYLEVPAMNAIPGMDQRVGAHVARKVGP